MLTSPDTDNRQAQRRSTLKGGRIVFNAGRSTINCTVRNLSLCSTAIPASPAGSPGVLSRNSESPFGRSTDLVGLTPTQASVLFLF
jgi:hypothetical protein